MLLENELDIVAGNLMDKGDHGLEIFVGTELLAKGSHTLEAI